MRPFWPCAPATDTTDAQDALHCCRTARSSATHRRLGSSQIRECYATGDGCQVVVMEMLQMSDRCTSASLCGSSRPAARRAQHHAGHLLLLACAYCRRTRMSVWWPVHRFHGRRVATWDARLHHALAASRAHVMQSTRQGRRTPRTQVSGRALPPDALPRPYSAASPPKPSGNAQHPPSPATCRGDIGVRTAQPACKPATCLLVVSSRLSGSRDAQRRPCHFELYTACAAHRTEHVLSMS